MAFQKDHQLRDSGSGSNGFCVPMVGWQTPGASPSGMRSRVHFALLSDLVEGPGTGIGILHSGAFKAGAPTLTAAR